MTLLFSLDNKRTTNYEKACRLKSIHQVVYQETWLVSSLVTLGIGMMMIIINVTDPSSNLANMNLLMRAIIISSGIYFTHCTFKLIYRPNATYKKICSFIRFPIVVNNIENIHTENFSLPGLKISYNVLYRRDIMGLLFLVEGRLIFIEELNIDRIGKNITMIMEAQEIREICRHLNVENNSKIEFVIAHLKGDKNYSRYEIIDSERFDDSVVVADVLTSSS